MARQIKKCKVKDVVNEIDALDLEAYPDEWTESYGTEWYDRRYDGREVVYVYYVDGKFVAYLTVSMVKQQFVRALLKGVLDGDMSVNNDMFKGDGKYIYFNSIVVSKDYRHQNIAHELIEAVMNDYSKSRICVIANEHSVKALLNYKFKVRNKTPHYTVMTKNM